MIGFESIQDLGTFIKISARKDLSFQEVLWANLFFGNVNLTEFEQLFQLFGIPENEIIEIPFKNSKLEFIKYCGSEPYLTTPEPIFRTFTNPNSGWITLIPSLSPDLQQDVFEFHWMEEFGAMDFGDMILCKTIAPVVCHAPGDSDGKRGGQVSNYRAALEIPKGFDIDSITRKDATIASSGCGRVLTGLCFAVQNRMFESADNVITFRVLDAY